VPVDEAGILEQILANVVGFDLNPLAVISARTNYLLALGDLLQHRRGEIDIPVYLADSILTPSTATEEGGQMSLEAGAVPASLVSAQYIDQLANLLEECVGVELEVSQFRTRLLATFPLDETRDQQDIEIAEQLYEHLLGLQQRGVNGIWARIIKNAFAPLFCEPFDYVAGNPPWVNWESLPDQYRDDTAQYWSKYRLFADDKPDRRQQSARSKSDISALMSYVCADRYLSREGILGFVITQTLFKSERGSKGFRQFELPDGHPLKIIHVDDMVRLQPFEGAQNRTSVFVLRAGRETAYPVPYTVWRKASRGLSLPQELPLRDIKGLTSRSRWVARPVDKCDDLSPWITGRERAIQSTEKLVGSSPYLDIAREGANTRGANGVYWVKQVGARPDGLCVVCNKPELGRRHDVSSCQAPVEDSLVCLLLRGQDAQRWLAEPSMYVLLPYVAGGGSSPIAEEMMQSSYPRAFRFLKRFEEVLRSRPKFRNFDPKNGIFYQMYSVGEYSFAEHKVVWREQASGLVAAVVSNKEGRVVVPDHKLILAPFDSATEAHFLCSCLNSSPAQFIVKSYSIETSISTHVLSYVAIPKYDPANELHNRLGSLSKKAHTAAAKGDQDTVARIEAKIDQAECRRTYHGY